MAAALDQKPDIVAKFTSQVDEQIAQATSRIRVHDLILGSLTLASMVVIYATAMISLDKYFNLSELTRQLSLLGFLAAFAAVAYSMVVRPLRNRINPLYAAALVEETIEDAKNSVTGYVDAQEKGNVHGAVRAAMSAKAAKAVGEADVNRAVDHRNLIIAGGVFLAFLVVLAVLFFIFRPSQFTSLVSRAFVPYSSRAIETRTQIKLLKPDPLEPTLTSGQTIVVAVHIGGKVPAKNAPDRVRLLLRHNPADPNYEELPLQEGDSSREWNLKVPEYLVQNGFWYKVAAGDTETQEYKVSRRSLPLFTDYEVSYEFPKYTRRAPEKGRTDPNLRAYRGTKIVLLARANCDVKDGLMKFTNTTAPVVGKVVAGKPDTLSFAFTATEPTNYRLSMTSATGERTADAPPFSIAIDTDSPPRIEIVKPEEPETPVPANGQLAVDATVGDDFGIDKARLCLRVDNRDLKPVPYEGGKSFRRKDDTWPNDLAYKGSVDLTKLAFTNGQKFEPAEGMLVEFWLEAIDNCTETKPVAGWGEKPQAGQVGKSEVRKIRLLPPKTEAEDKKQLDDQKNRRQNEEKQHNQQQQQKFDNEKRDPPQPQDKGQQPPQDGPKQDGPEKKEGNDPNGKGMADPMNPKKDGGNNQNPPEKNPPDKQDTTGNTGNKDPMTNPMSDPKTDPKQPMGKEPKDPSGMGNNGMSDPKTPPEAKNDPKTPMSKDPKDPSGMGNGGMSDPKMPEAKTGEQPKTGDQKGMNNGMGGMNDPNMQPMQPETAPMPKSEEQKKAEADAKRVQDELDKTKGEGGDVKPNPEANTKPEDRANPSEAKPQPPMGGGQDAQPQQKPEPKQNGPMNPMNPMGDKNAASENKPAGKLEQPDKNGQQKPEPKSQPNGEKNNPAERRDGALGGDPGEEKSPPKQGGEQPKDPKDSGKDPMSGSTAKPPTEQKSGDPKGPEPKKNPGDNASSTKPNVEPSRGQEKNPGQESQPSEKPDPNKPDQTGGTAKPDKAQPSAETKPQPKDGGGKQPEATETKPQPKDAKDPSNPMGNGGASETKPAPQKPMPGMENGGEKDSEPGMEKPDPKKDNPQGGNNGGKKIDEKKMKELQDAAKDLANPDKAKREAAQQKLDKEIGEKNRQDLEKEIQKEADQLAKDLQSPDKATREAAEKKVQDAINKANEQAKKDGKTGDPKDPKGGNGQKLDEKQLKDLQDTAKDLASNDPAKQEAARQKLDKQFGENARKNLEKEMQKQGEKEAEQTLKDLQSPDKATREAAEKKVQDAINKANEQAKKDGGSDEKGPKSKDGQDGKEKGKELTKEEIKDLAKKAEDLNSKDPMKREAAEKEFDQKFGKEAREQLQEEMKKQPMNDPMDPKQQGEMQRKLEDMAKKNPPKGDADSKSDRFQPEGRGGNEPPKPEDPTDPRNKLKTAQLQLEEFEKNRYNRDLQEKLKWTPEDYEKFLEAQRKRVEQLRTEQAKQDEEARQQPPMLGDPSFKAGGARPVEAIQDGTVKGANRTGAVYAPPGFDDAKRKFAEQLQKLQQKK